MASTASRVRMPCARALYGFQGQAPYELNFSAGVSIQLLRRVDENWLEGKLEEKIGIFPASHVSIEVGSPSVARENALASSGKPYAVALHTFQGTQPRDLSFIKGDLIELVGAISNQGWLHGKMDAITGIFPASFVAILRYPVKEETDSQLDAETSRTNQRPVPKPRPNHTKHSANTQHPPPVATASLVPSRSAPAPPNSYTHASKHGTLPRSAPPTGSPPVKGYGTLPKPKPRKHARTTSANRVDILESELAIERKFLETAESLLAADQHSHTKAERRAKAISNHKSKISHLQTAIAEAKENEEEATVDTPPPLPPPPRQTLSVSSEEQLRRKVIDELVFTERDFYHQMDLCSRKVLPALREVPEIQSSVLFGNMEEVAALSGDFLKALEEACQDKKEVGGVFMTFAPKMRTVYGAYCRNHDNASSLYEKYMDTPAITESIHQAMDMLRGEIQAWDLQSLLIKPVQRVLKYPLLIDKLVQSTSSGHSDHKAVHSAKEAISKVAQDINEIKRRKDLVVKYTAKDDRRGSLSVHSIQKKMRRFQQTLTQFTGLRSKTIDPKFDDLEQKVTSLESLIRTLLKDIASYQEQLNHVVESRVVLMEGMILFCTNSQQLTNFQSYMSQLQQILKTHIRFVKNHVTVPLETLLGLFQNPVHLIQKRKDKLLDYDHLQYALDHTEDSEKIAQLREEVLLAKRNYEALNTQLLEELPDFIDAVVTMLQHQLTALLQAQYTFTSSAATVLPPLLPRKSQPTTFTEIEQQHTEELAVICKEMAKLSVVPASLAYFKTSSTQRTSENSPSNRIAASSEETVAGRDMGSGAEGVRDGRAGIEVKGDGQRDRREEREDRGGDVREEEDEEEDFEEELEVVEDTPTVGSRLRVLFEFVGEDPSELSVAAGQGVVLMCPHDRIGCKDWWLVQAAQDRQGYVPASYLSVEGVS